MDDEEHWHYPPVTPQHHYLTENGSRSVTNTTNYWPSSSYSSPYAPQNRQTSCTPLASPSSSSLGTGNGHHYYSHPPPPSYGNGGTFEYGPPMTAQWPPHQPQPYRQHSSSSASHYGFPSSPPAYPFPSQQFQPEMLCSQSSGDAMDQRQLVAGQAVRSKRPAQQTAYTAQQKVQHWNQFGAGQLPPNDSGVHSMSQSTANSVMSSLHPLSCISAVSSLPDELPPTLQDHPYFQHIPSSLRYEDPEKMRRVLPDLIPLINDEDEEVALNALSIINGIAKKDKALGMSRPEGPLITEQRVVEELLRTLKKHRKNKKVVTHALRTLHFISDNEPSGRELFVRTVDSHGTDCLEELVHSIGIQEQSCFKYAFLVLHNLMSDARIGRRVIEYMREQRILTQVLGWLGDRNEKFLHIVTDIVHKLVARNTEQMAFFLGLNGHQKLVNVIANCHQETLLFRATKLLEKVVQLDPERMVASGVLEALQRHLQHPSQRLLHQVLKCILMVSDIPSTEHHIQPLLQTLLQLLGTNDQRMKESCADILANLCANNAQNKAYLVDQGAVPALFQLLYELDSLRALCQGGEQLHRQMEGVQETALTLLRSLCTGANNTRALAAKQQILASDAHRRLLLQKLREWHPGLLRRTLLLIQQLANESGVVQLLRFSLNVGGPRYPHFPDAPMAQMAVAERCSFVTQTVQLLQHSVNQLPGTLELCRHCLDTLRAMCLDPVLLNEIFSELRGHRVRMVEGQTRLLIPQLLLCFCDQLAGSAIALMAELASRVPDAALQMGKHSATVDALWRRTRRNEAATLSAQDAHTAETAARMLQLIGATGSAAKTTQPFGVGAAKEELAPVELGHNDSPAEMLQQVNSMDCSPAGPSSNHSSSNSNNNHGLFPPHPPSPTHYPPQQPIQQKASEQLGGGGTLEEMQQDYFADELGPFLNALCPNSSPNWAPPSNNHCQRPQ